MNELTTYQGGLPDTMEDLARFLLIAPEKATALRAEIRAIEKVGLAKAVYDQKLEEQRRLCDMILDASVRLGEMTRAIPKASHDRGNQYTSAKTTVLSSSQKPKTAAVQELGFSPKQVERFETLADNKDLVEREKAVAREEGRMPTRTNVIHMTKERKAREQSALEAHVRNLRAFRKAVSFSEMLAVTDEMLDSVVKLDDDLAATIAHLNNHIMAVEALRNRLIAKGSAKHGKSHQ